jgi:hypothetical protein
MSRARQIELAKKIAARTGLFVGVDELREACRKANAYDLASFFQNMKKDDRFEPLRPASGAIVGWCFRERSRTSRSDEVYWLEGWTGKHWQVLRELHPEGRSPSARDLEAIRMGLGSIQGTRPMRVRVERVLWEEKPKTPRRRRRAGAGK